MKSLTVKGKAGIRLVDNLSLDVRAGEIVCIYGLMGAGRTELMECVAGRLRQSSGEIHIEESDVSGLSIAERIASGGAGAGRPSAGRAGANHDRR